jgi:histidinol phosphatase-like PHP family hydrolase
VPLTNGDIAELLSRESEQQSGHRQRALRRAARAALWRWPLEAAALRESERPLTELELVGPWIASLIDGWLEQDVDPPRRPPVRASFLTLSEARSTLRTHPEWVGAYRGDLQVHTTWSDGAGTLASMAIAAVARGYSYVGFTDHTKGLPIARGMDENTVRRQWREIAELGPRLPRGFTILRSLEMNLSPEGQGDMDADLVADLDLLVAAFHSKLRLDNDQTPRYLKAVANPQVHVLAHPRGRRYDVRVGLRADWDVVARAAAERDLALEIDSWPDRQDLDVDSLRSVAAAGGRVAIDTDAHASDELRFVEFGLAAAIRAGIKKDRVVNFLPVDELRAWAAASSQIARRSWSGWGAADRAVGARPVESVR